MSTDLSDQVAMVSGAGAGIGAGIARALAAAGATVVGNDLDAEALTAVAAAIDDAGGRLVPVVGDIRDPDVVAEFHRTGEEVAGGAVDVLVNNVGDFRPARRDFLASTEAQWQAMYEINLLHVLRCTHAVLPAMVDRGRGSIVNVSTVEAIRGIPANTAYSAFKAGVSAFTRSLAVEVGRDGVRVNAIAPDLTDTPQTPRHLMLRDRDPDLIETWIPMGRFGEADDCAAVVVFLAGSDARFVTGQTIPVDGGTLSASGWYRRADGKGWTNMPDRP